MDSLVEGRKYCLLYWYNNERHWTIQSVNTILKPRRDEYIRGDLVLAKCQGKPYHAAVIGIEAEKDRLVDAKIMLESLLKQPDLTPEMVMKEMGIENVDMMKVVEPAKKTENALTSSCKKTSATAAEVATFRAPDHGTTVRKCQDAKTPEKSARKKTDHDVKAIDQDVQTIEKPDQSVKNIPDPDNYMHISEESMSIVPNSTLKRISKLEDEVKALKSELRSVKKKLKKTSETSEESSMRDSNAKSPQEEDNIQLDNCLKKLHHLSANTEKEINDIIKRATFTIFTSVELINCSRTGKKTVKSRDTVRQRLDDGKFKILEQVVLTKCPTVAQNVFIKKFENIQKVVRRKAALSAPPENATQDS